MEKTQPIVLVVGARPNFMKATPLVRAFRSRKVPYHLIHTGQHYDTNMATRFFQEFRVRPDTRFTLTSSTSAAQLAEIVSKLETVFLRLRPRMVVVFGDVTSTLAGALTAERMHIPVAHVEAGLRSYNNLMPEEANRRLTDHCASLLFAPSREDRERLHGEGIRKGVHVVGNIMIDLLAQEAKQVEAKKESYYFATLHRAENVDRKEVLAELIHTLETIGKDAPIYLPLHPRTAKMAKKHGLLKRLSSAAHLLPPLSYHDSVAYQKSARLVLTDSGGIQEESSFLGVPCLTLRTETERPITVSKGTNVVGGIKYASIMRAYRSLHPLKRRTTNIPLWDGKTAERIADILLQHP